ncbi:N-acetylmuramoyl-L-alanine amidase [Agathobaculum sp. Marseille-P7918]|uniref:N-acetylmuramoyl-L-alanine amidase n=1 Tax=Agathobaculum sp. Marseille-P7918 TaxID=2479843 RepID=UPI0035662709
MRFKRIIALLCAAIYISISGAGAAELPQTALADETEIMLSSEVQPEEQASTETDLPVARASTLKIVPSTHHVQVNGEAVNPQAYNIDGYNYFKLRDLAYLLNGTTISFNVTWDSAKNAVNLISGQAYTVVGGEMTVASTTSLRVQESTSKVLLDGSGVSIKGYNINGNNYYKIADVSSAIGFTAAYESTTQTVQIKTPSAPQPEPEPEPEPEKPDEPFVTGIYQVKVDSTLSIRSGPGTSYGVVGQLSNGAQIIVDEMKNGWAHIKNTSGYCSADYLTRIKDYGDDAEPEEPEEPEEPFVTGVYRVKVDSSLSVRSGPGTSYSIVGRLQNGDEIVVDSMEKGWAHLMDTSAGTGRYCSADYLTRIGDYDASQGEPEDPVEPPRTSHLDGKMTVILDAGHGGSDIGAHNADMSLDEKHVNLYVAQYLQSYLEDAGVNVIMVRDTMEDGSSLSLRGTVMEQNAVSADLFFSIHHNAANTTARGAEVLAQIADKTGGPSKILGEALLEEYDTLGIPIRQVVFKEGSNGDYYYTNRIAASLFIPAVTSEFCFIDNEEDQKFIDSEEDWQAEARAQYNAIMYYFTQVEY